MQEFEVRDDIENIIYILITILLNEADWSTWWIIASYLSFGKRRVGWMTIWMKKIPFYSDFQNTCLFGNRWLWHNQLYAKMCFLSLQSYTILVGFPLFVKVHIGMIMRCMRLALMRARLVDLYVEGLTLVSVCFILGQLIPLQFFFFCSAVHDKSLLHSWKVLIVATVWTHIIYKTVNLACHLLNVVLIVIVIFEW